MAGKPTCLVCQKEMELGFLTDMGDYQTIHVPVWCAGEPKPGFFSGEVKSAQRRQGLKVVAYRCPQCEALRLYAPSNPQ
jgi:hypothetical protein